MWTVLFLATRDFWFNVPILRPIVTCKEEAHERTSGEQSVVTFPLIRTNEGSQTSPVPFRNTFCRYCFFIWTKKIELRKSEVKLFAVVTRPLVASTPCAIALLTCCDKMAASETEHRVHVHKSPAAAQKPPHLRALEVAFFLYCQFFPLLFSAYVSIVFCLRVSAFLRVCHGDPLAFAGARFRPLLPTATEVQVKKIELFAPDYLFTFFFPCIDCLKSGFSGIAFSILAQSSVGH